MKQFILSRYNVVICIYLRLGGIKLAHISLLWQDNFLNKDQNKLLKSIFTIHLFHPSLTEDVWRAAKLADRFLRTSRAALEMLRLAIEEAIFEPQFDNGMKIKLFRSENVILEKKWNCLRPFAVQLDIDTISTWLILLWNWIVKNANKIF